VLSVVLWNLFFSRLFSKTSFSCALTNPACL
jgi:hypothetical protein